MKILANDGISDLGKQLLEASGHIVITDKVAQDQLAHEVNAQGIEAILVRSATTVRKEVIDACPNVKIIGRGGVGMDNIDVEYARNKGIHVINTPASSSQSVAELVMGQLFSLSRFLHGFGRIGQSLASYALGVGMNVIAIDSKSQDVQVKVTVANQDVLVNMTTETDLHNVLGEMDYISIHVPKQKDGSAVLGAKEFARMKKGVFISNAARGGVVDETDLIEALNNGTIAGIALDVYENEPNPKKELLSHPRIACTPHIGAATLEAQDRIGEELAQLIIELAK
jgi:D-3-phosphoglycerate dehydrogenase / 2-oxoglutarate reductase